MPVLPGLVGSAASSPTGLFRRLRPSDPDWPNAASWAKLNGEVRGRLIKVVSPFEICREVPQGSACSELSHELKNPYFIGDQVNLTQTTGWVDAWTSQQSVYAVAVETTQDVVATVNFARDKKLRLVVKGGGHSYLGTSNAPDSLLIWTRRMAGMALHDEFAGEGCVGREAPHPAVIVGAGAIWGHTYNKVTSEGGRYVQGGGCLTVGVAGLVQAGGFGSFSKNFGTAAASLLEAEIVTADGVVRIANHCTNPDLFWGLKGGGGGSLGVVTRLTLKTHELPSFIGLVQASIVASSEAAFRRLVGRFVDFYADNLLNPHWADSVSLRSGNRLNIAMTFQGLARQEAEAVWQPFFDWIGGAPDDFTYQVPPNVIAVPARDAWDPGYLRANFPKAVLSDDRPRAPSDKHFLVMEFGRMRAFSLWLSVGVAAHFVAAARSSRGADRCIICRQPAMVGRTAHAKGARRRLRRGNCRHA
jgi:hypothetical protein